MIFSLFQLYCFRTATIGEVMVDAGGKVLQRLGKTSRLDKSSDVGVYEICNSGNKANE